MREETLQNALRQRTKMVSGCLAIILTSAWTVGSLSIPGLEHAARIHAGEYDLEEDESVCVIVQTPCDPQDIAGEKPPETSVTTGFMIGCHQP